MVPSAHARYEGSPLVCIMKPKHTASRPFPRAPERRSEAQAVVNGPRVVKRLEGVNCVRGCWGGCGC